MIATGIFAKDVGLTTAQPRLLRAPPGAGDRGRVLVRRLVDPLQDDRPDHPAARVGAAGDDGLDLSQHGETVSSRGVRAAFESIQGELFTSRDV